MKRKYQCPGCNSTRYNDNKQRKDEKKENVEEDDSADASIYKEETVHDEDEMEIYNHNSTSYKKSRKRKRQKSRISKNFTKLIHYCLACYLSST